MSLKRSSFMFSDAKTQSCESQMAWRTWPRVVVPRADKLPAGVLSSLNYKSPRSLQGLPATVWVSFSPRGYRTLMCLIQAFQPLVPVLWVLILLQRWWLLFIHSVVSDSVTPGTVACQAPLSMGLPRQEYWSGLLFPSPRDLPYPGTQPVSPALAGIIFTTEPAGKFFTEVVGL